MNEKIPPPGLTRQQLKDKADAEKWGEPRVQPPDFYSKKNTPPAERQKPANTSVISDDAKTIAGMSDADKMLMLENDKEKDPAKWKVREEE